MNAVCKVCWELIPWKWGSFFCSRACLNGYNWEDSKKSFSRKKVAKMKKDNEGFWATRPETTQEDRVAWQQEYEDEENKRDSADEARWAEIRNGTRNPEGYNLFTQIMEHYLADFLECSVCAEPARLLFWNANNEDVVDVSCFFLCEGCYKERPYLNVVHLDGTDWEGRDIPALYRIWYGG